MRSFLIFLFLCSTLYCFAQLPDSTNCRIVDAATGDPLPGATVQWQNGAAITDLHGRFRLDPDSVQVVITHIGYAKREILLSPGLEKGCLIELTPATNVLERVTVTGSRYEERAVESVVSVEVLDQEFLDRSHATSVEDVLNKVPGVQVIDGQANIRGGSGYSYGAGSRVLLLLNDLPILQADAGFPNWDNLPMENVGRVEVVKGAASALYGSAALNGIINFRLREPTHQPMTKVKAYGALYGAPGDKRKKWWDTPPTEYGISVSDTRKAGRWGFITSAYYDRGETYERENKVELGRLFSHIRYKPSTKWLCELSSNFNRGRNSNFFYWKDAGEGAYTADPVNITQSDYFRFNIDPAISYFTGKFWVHKLSGRIYSIDNRNSNGRSNSSLNIYSEYQVQKEYSSVGLKGVAGAVMTYTSAEAALYGNQQFQSQGYAAFLQLQKELGQKLRISVGARYEFSMLDVPFSDQDGNSRDRFAMPVFRAGIHYQPGEYTHLRLSAGEGFRFPTIAEKYVETTIGPTMVSANPDLGSETGWSSEAGVRQGWRWGPATGFFDLAAFWSEYDNMIEFVFAGLDKGFQAENVGDTRITGIEISGQAMVTFGAFRSDISAGYTYLDPVYRDFTEDQQITSTADYNILKYRSRHKGQYDLKVSIGRWSGGIGGYFYSNVDAIDGIFEIVIPGLKDYRQAHNRTENVVSARASWHWSDNISSRIVIENLLNREYSLRPGLLEPPRKYVLEFELSL